MLRALLRTQREHAEVVLKPGHGNMENLAQEVGCSTSQMVKMRANMKRFDLVVKHKSIVQGRPKKITPAIEQVSSISYPADYTLMASTGNQRGPLLSTLDVLG